MTAPIEIRPSEATVSQVGSWQIIYRVPHLGLGPGAVLELTLAYHSQLPFHWQTTEPQEEGFATVSGPPGTRFELSAQSRQTLQATLAAGTVGAGDSITFTLGEGSQGSPGLRVWPVAHDLEFTLASHPGGERYAVVIPVRPGPADRLLMKCPSTPRVGTDIPLLVRAVDANGNTATDCDAATQVTAPDGVKVPSQVKPQNGIGWTEAKITGSRTGAARIAVRGPQDRLSASSNPVEIAADDAEQIFWGDLHCHTNLAQALESPDFLYAYAKHEEALDFICHTEHDAGTEERWIGPRWRDWEPPVTTVPDYVQATWEYRKELVRQHHEPGKFVTILGYEWASNLYGHLNVYYATDDAPIFYPDNYWQEEYSPAVLWENLAGIEAITVPHHVSHRIRSEPGGFVSGWDWDYHTDDRLRLVEVYSKHGNSEYPGCPRRIGDQVPEGCVQAALARGYKVGFVADTDTHASRPGSDLAGDLYFRQGGITAVFAERLERGAIFEALKRRRCYGTTGQRIIMRFWVNDAFMGEETALEDARAPKAVRFQIEGTAPISSAVVIKNNREIFQQGSSTPSLAAELTDKAETQGTDFYYLRVTQEDGEMAWASPIWVSSQ